VNTDKEEGEELLEVFGQVADVSLELATALDQHGFAREHSGTRTRLPASRPRSSCSPPCGAQHPRTNSPRNTVPLGGWLVSGYKC
jgi:hypothetical protein